MIRRVGIYLSVALMAAVMITWTAADPLGAQEATEVAVEETAVPATLEPTATPSAYPLRSLTFNLLAQADLNVTTSGPAVVSAATLAVPAGATTVTFLTEGETVISATTGTVTVASDRGVLGVADIGASIGLDTVAGTPGPLDAVTVSAGGQVYLPAGATVTLSNDTEAAATLLIVTVVPSAAGAAGE